MAFLTFYSYNVTWLVYGWIGIPWMLVSGLGVLGDWVSTGCRQGTLCYFAQSLDERYLQPWLAFWPQIMAVILWHVWYRTGEARILDRKNPPASAADRAIWNRLRADEAQREKWREQGRKWKAWVKQERALKRKENRMNRYYLRIRREASKKMMKRRETVRPTYLWARKDPGSNRDNQGGID